MSGYPFDWPMLEEWENEEGENVRKYFESTGEAP